jgi:N6-adenosine-specific RNA methylase IME4
MKEHIVKKTNEFVAVSRDGKPYTIIEHTTFTLLSPVDTGIHRKPPMTQEYRLDNGEQVNKISAGVFEIIMTGERIVAL